jgi:iron uptake system EfeUOB component EfeO/EfeM
MPTIATYLARKRSAVRVLTFCIAALTGAAIATARVDAASLSEGAKSFKPFVVEHIGIALAGAKKLQTAVKAGDAKAAQAAWIESRKGWEAIEPVTGEYFRDLDKVIDAWPDATQGYHAIEAVLFAGKLEGLAAPVDKLVDNLGKVEKRAKAKSFSVSPQRLLNGAANLAYEIGETKSKGGESPYAGTSVIDLHENLEGIEAAYKLVFADTLKKADPELAKLIHDRIESLEALVKVSDIKSLDQRALHVAGEELAVLLQGAAPKMKLKKPKVGEDD